MKTRILKATCAVMVAVLLTGASARIARAQFPYVPSLPFSSNSTAERVVTAAVIAATIYFIARYEATERQREVAEMRARQLYAHMELPRQADTHGRKLRYIAEESETGQEAARHAK